MSVTGAGSVWLQPALSHRYSDTSTQATARAAGHEKERVRARFTLSADPKHARASTCCLFPEPPQTPRVRVLTRIWRTWSGEWSPAPPEECCGEFCSCSVSTRSPSFSLSLLHTDSADAFTSSFLLRMLVGSEPRPPATNQSTANPDHWIGRGEQAAPSCVVATTVLQRQVCYNSTPAIV